MIGAAIEVHRELGPGHLENTYERALAFELARRNTPCRVQIWIRVKYKGEIVGRGKIDIIVNERLVVEVKAVSDLLPIHSAQTLSYLRATGLQLGLLINLNESTLKQGIKRIVNTRSKEL